MICSDLLDVLLGALEERASIEFPELQVQDRYAKKLWELLD